MKTKNNGKQADNCKNIKEAKREIRNIVRNLQKQGTPLWEIWPEPSRVQATNISCFSTS